MAWILVLFFLPVAGWILYLFFGRSTRKEHLISRKGYARLSKRPMAAYQEAAVRNGRTWQAALMDFFSRVNNALPSPEIELQFIRMLFPCYRSY